MDTIYDYLKWDHKKVDDLFTQFEKTPTLKAKTDFAKMICKELLIHAIAEQETFYAYLKNEAETRDEIIHSEKEHDQIKNQILEILTTKNITKAWEDKVIELMKIVKHHVKEEENDLFPKAKKVISDYEAYVIREKMHDYKEKILSKWDEIGIEAITIPPALKKESSRIQKNF